MRVRFPRQSAPGVKYQRPLSGHSGCLSPFAGGRNIQRETFIYQFMTPYGNSSERLFIEDISFCFYFVVQRPRFRRTAFVAFSYLPPTVAERAGSPPSASAFIDRPLVAQRNDRIRSRPLESRELIQPMLNGRRTSGWHETSSSTRNRACSSAIPAGSGVDYKSNVRERLRSSAVLC